MVVATAVSQISINIEKIMVLKILQLKYNRIVFRNTYAKIWNHWDLNSIILYPDYLCDVVYNKKLFVRDFSDKINPQEQYIDS